MTDYASAMKSFLENITNPNSSGTDAQPKLNTSDNYAYIYKYVDLYKDANGKYKTDYILQGDLPLLHGNGFYHEGKRARINASSNGVIDLSFWNSADKPSSYIEMGKFYTPGRGFLWNAKQKYGWKNNDKPRKSAANTDYVAIVFTKHGRLLLLTSFYIEERRKGGKEDNTYFKKRQTGQVEIYDDNGNSFYGENTVLFLDRFGCLNQINYNGEIIHKLNIAPSSGPFSSLKLYAQYRDREGKYTEVYYKLSNKNPEAYKMRRQRYHIDLISEGNSTTKTLGSFKIWGSGSYYIHPLYGNSIKTGDDRTVVRFEIEATHDDFSPDMDHIDVNSDDDPAGPIA